MFDQDIQRSVSSRYAEGAQEREEALCCPVEYDPQYLKVIPEEVIERDYGCGDPSQYLQPGDKVLDLGSGTGKICFIASQVVGAQGEVIGVDMTDEMLDVARRAAPTVADGIGHANVSFRKGHIEDLALDIDALDEWLQDNPVSSADGYRELEQKTTDLRRNSPLIASDSVDVVVSNCVLNLVEPSAKAQMFDEIFRVLKNGGRAVISDIAADEPVPAHLQANEKLWSGCISGAFTEEGFIRAFEKAGFHGIEILDFGTDPWQEVEGIQFRSMTVRAWKGRQGPRVEKNQAVVYKGPFREVLDDDGHRMRRGQRTAVCEKTMNLLRQPPYSGQFEFIEPVAQVGDDDAEEFDCQRARRRDPKETKGKTYRTTSDPDQGSCC